MNRRSKFLMALIAVAVLLCVAAVALVACGDKDGDDKSGNDKNPPAHVHNYTPVEAKAPTCTEDGHVMYYTCECGKYFNENKSEITEWDTILFSQGHDKENDWESDGVSHWHKCKNCDEKLDLASHAAGESWQTDGTQHWHTCEYCGAKLDIASHMLGEWIEDEGEATCLKKATRHKECSVCTFHTASEEFGDFADHKYSKTDAIAPTCTTDGNEEYYTCDICGKFFDSQKQETDGVPTLPAAHDKVTDKWESDGESHWHKCNNCDEKLDLTSHTFGEWVNDDEATCLKKATHHMECTDCTYSTESEKYGNALPHSWNEDTNECDVCGITKPYEERNDKIYFGEYPQTKITDNGITATLAQMSGDRPVEGNSGKWTDYGYYISRKKSEYMWYIDLEYLGARYRGVYFTSYRPECTDRVSKADNSYQDENGFSPFNLYWFQWKPIEWRVLERTEGKAFLMSNVILDAQAYQDEVISKDGKSYTSFNGAPEGTFANNYKYSSIRYWLNNTFYNWAFDGNDQSIIRETLVDNSVESTREDYNKFVCENTTDEIFLLSNKDLAYSNYGFNYSTRELKSTSYAKSQGAYSHNIFKENIGSGWWWGRSPHSSYDYDAYVVFYTGKPESTGGVYDTSYGVVPAVKITL